MGVKKLTLSAPADAIEAAKRIAAQKRTSVSALFVRLIRAADEDLAPCNALGPITQRASGIVSLPSDRSVRDLLADALDEKYGKGQ